VLRAGERPVAAQIASEWAGRLWIIKIGYDEAYARCSPGVLLMIEAIRWASEHGLRSYEFLGSDEPWIRPWSTGMCEHESVAFYPYTPSGLAAFGTDMAHALWRRVAGALSARPRSRGATGRGA
jgi:CelD/BcsL family acetyltransferase involved in cellulose biosynthesis